MVTVFRYMYRDGANFKTFESITLDGAITTEQILQIDKALLRDECGDDFLPLQVGIQPSCPSVNDGHYDDVLDHPVHTVTGIAIKPGTSPGAIKAADFVSKFVAVGADGWDQESYGNN